MWEFHGGKVEEGETLEECLVREIKEEMRIKIEVTKRMIMVDHKYPTFDIRLCALRASIIEGELHLNDHEKVIDVKPKDLLSLDLTPADQQVAKAINLIA
jgi:8-oxo-dGTP diphosphatase